MKKETAEVLVNPTVEQLSYNIDQESLLIFSFLNAYNYFVFS
jgi:hypothetical protein